MAGHAPTVSAPRRSRSVQLAAKRAMDLVIGTAVALVGLPVGLVVAAAVRVTMGPPVLYTQVRPGRDEVPFTLYKFRTMNDEVDERGQPLPDRERLTRLGRLLRAMSLDELPQVVNILRGEMSLVGPRPLMMRYLPKYTPEQRRRHAMRPGVTGWAQVNGRQSATYGERIALDLWYVDHWSLWLDVKILARTALVVLTRRNVVLGQSVDEVDDLGFWVADGEDAQGS